MKQYNNMIISNLSHILVFYFHSILCQSCFPQFTILEQYFKNNNNIMFNIIDIDKSKEIVQELDITSIPLVQIYKNGKMLDTCYGSEICLEIIKTKIDNCLFEKSSFNK